MTRTRAADKKEDKDTKVETLKSNSKDNVSKEDVEKPSLVKDLKKDKRQSIRLASRSTPTKELEGKTETKRSGRSTPVSKKTLDVSDKLTGKRKPTIEEEKESPKKKRGEEEKKSSQESEGSQKEETTTKVRRHLNEKETEKSEGGKCQEDKENYLPSSQKTEEEKKESVAVTPKNKGSDGRVVTSANKSSGGSKSLKEVRSRHIPESPVTDTPRGSRRRSARLSVSTPKHKELGERIIGKRKNTTEKETTKKLKSEDTEPSSEKKDVKSQEKEKPVNDKKASQHSKEKISVIEEESEGKEDRVVSPNKASLLSAAGDAQAIKRSPRTEKSSNSHGNDVPGSKLTQCASSPSKKCSPLKSTSPLIKVSSSPDGREPVEVTSAPLLAVVKKEESEGGEKSEKANGRVSMLDTEKVQVTFKVKEVTDIKKEPDVEVVDETPVKADEVTIIGKVEPEESENINREVDEANQIIKQDIEAAVKTNDQEDKAIIKEAKFNDVKETDEAVEEAKNTVNEDDKSVVNSNEVIQEGVAAAEKIPQESIKKADENETIKEVPVKEVCITIKKTEDDSIEVTCPTSEEINVEEAVAVVEICSPTDDTNEKTETRVEVMGRSNEMAVEVAKKSNEPSVQNVESNEMNSDVDVLETVKISQKTVVNEETTTESHLEVKKAELEESAKNEKETLDVAETSSVEIQKEEGRSSVEIEGIGAVVAEESGRKEGTAVTDKAVDRVTAPNAEEAQLEAPDENSSSASECKIESSEVLVQPLEVESSGPVASGGECPKEPVMEEVSSRGKEKGSGGTVCDSNNQSITGISEVDKKCSPHKSSQEDSDKDEVNIKLAVEVNDVEIGTVGSTKHPEVEVNDQPNTGANEAEESIGMTPDPVSVKEEGQGGTALHSLRSNDQLVNRVSSEMTCDEGSHEETPVLNKVEGEELDEPLKEEASDTEGDNSSDESISTKGEKEEETPVGNYVKPKHGPIPSGSSQTTKRNFKSAFIRDLDISTTSDDLHKVFSDAGLENLKDVTVIKKVYAIVHFETESDFKKAMSLESKLTLNGAPLKIAPNEHEKCSKSKKSRHRKHPHKTQQHFLMQGSSSSNQVRGGSSGTNNPRKSYMVSAPQDSKVFSSIFERMQQRNTFQPPTRYFGSQGAGGVGVGSPSRSRQQPPYRGGGPLPSSPRAPHRHHHHHPDDHHHRPYPPHNHL